MIASIPPGMILIGGGLLIALLPRRWRALATVLVPALSFAQLLALEPGTSYHMQLFGAQLTMVRVDRLSLLFGYIFHIAAILGAIYAVHVQDRLQQVSVMLYIGTAIGAVFAGDLLTLFVYWELTAVTSVFLVWAGRTERAFRAGIRYLVIQVASGVLLLAGAVVQYWGTGSVTFDRLIGADGLLRSAGPGVLLIFFAFGIKAAFPLLHNWLQDAYPESTATGTVFLSIFTTKLAIYALARAFPGTTVLIWIGAIMAAFPIFYAVIENDLRRVLAYSLNNQLGFMVAGIGIGTAMAVNGAVAYAFVNIIFEGLLFMAMGAVLDRTGTIKGSELGGLYKSMPLTTAFCIVGAASISGFPFLNGFVTKGLILDGVALGGWIGPWVVLLFASAGVFHHAGIKIPYFAFFAHDAGIRVKEARVNMLLAMGAMAALCIGIGVYPKPLYHVLPFPVEYHPYTLTHVVTMYQLLLFSALAFTVLKRTGIYPPELRSVNLDSDWVYRRLGPALVGVSMSVGGAVRDRLAATRDRLLGLVYREVYRLHGPGGLLARTWNTGAIALLAVLGLWGFLLLYFWSR